ncbi:MAG: hypothetical protein JSR40_00960 [Proteobacteria bacterium]|nr:hypothetical protein [Pseudomonadota bacterium]
MDCLDRTPVHLVAARGHTHHPWQDPETRMRRGFGSIRRDRRDRKILQIGGTDPG